MTLTFQPSQGNNTLWYYDVLPLEVWKEGVFLALSRHLV